MPRNGLRERYNIQPGFSAVNNETANSSINGPVFTIEDSLRDFDHNMANSHFQGPVLTRKHSLPGASEKVEGAKVATPAGSTKAESQYKQKIAEISRKLLDERKAMVKISNEMEEMELGRNQISQEIMLAPPVLVHLVGPNVKDYEPMTLTYRILSVIEEHIARGPI